jgi:hypothetical protein
MATHRHTPEIEQELGALAGSPLRVAFTPHLVPLNRGLFTTASVPLVSAATTARLLDVYREFYAGEPFVRVLDEGERPTTRTVVGSTTATSPSWPTREPTVRCVSRRSTTSAGQRRERYPESQHHVRLGRADRRGPARVPLGMAAAELQWLDGGITAVPGILAGGVVAGIKPSGKKDLALIYSSTPARAAAVFTSNQVKGAPVLVSSEHVRGGQAQAIVASSGCSNVCTGEQGVADAREMTRIVGDLLRIPANHVLVAATGVIGFRCRWTRSAQRCPTS